MWINSSWSSSIGAAYFTPEDICPGNPNLYFCSTHVDAKDFRVTQSGRVIAMAGNTGPGYVLAEYWPNPRVITTSVTTVQKVLDAGTSLVVYGVNSVGQSITIVYDPESGAERTLIPASSQTEIYNLAYSASTGEVFFDRLRFSDNSYVVGKVNVASGGLTYLGTTTTSFSDFQAF